MPNNKSDLRGAFNLLLKAAKREDIEKALEIMEGHGLKWRPVDDDEGNHSVITISSNPDAGLIERVTNAIDATLEHRADQDLALATLKSPRAFVEQGYGIPEGHLTKMTNKPREKLTDDLGVNITVHNGNAADTPTIDIRDYGTGIFPTAFPTTILSLHKRNKIKKWYVMGRYGHGGSTALRFSEYTVIISRANTSGNITVGFTIVKYQKAAEGERDGMYVYAVDAQKNVFSVQTSTFPPGTLVRQVNFKFNKKGIFLNFYGVLDTYLFDPVLPYTLTMDVGSQYDGDRRMHGSRGRLSTSKTIEVRNDEGEKVPLDGDGKLGFLVVRYWVFKGDTETKTKQSFVNPDEPIVITYIGQTHATLPKSIITKECKLPYIADDLVIQVECDGTTDEGRRMMFASTREVVTQEGRDIITAAVVNSIKHDEQLHDLDLARQQQFITKGTSKAKDAMRRRLAEMINRIKPGKFTIKSGAGKVGAKKKAKSKGSASGPNPLSTKTFPTFLSVANKPNPLSFEVGTGYRIEINTDAPDGFLKTQGASGGLHLSEESLKRLKILTQSPDFKGGRYYLTLQPVEGASAGEAFTFQVTLNGVHAGQVKTFSADRAAVIEKPSGGGGDGGAAPTDGPEIIEVGPEVDTLEGRAWWKSKGWTHKDVAQVMDAGDSIQIYVSVANEYYLGVLEKGSYSKTGLDLIKSKYILLTAFHAYLQDDSEKGLSSQGQVTDEQRHAEMQRAARTILTAITSESAFKEA